MKRKEVLQNLKTHIHGTHDDFVKPWGQQALAPLRNSSYFEECAIEISISLAKECLHKNAPLIAIMLSQINYSSLSLNDKKTLDLTNPTVLDIKMLTPRLGCDEHEWRGQCGVSEDYFIDCMKYSSSIPKKKYLHKIPVLLHDFLLTKTMSHNQTRGKETGYALKSVISLKTDKIFYKNCWYEIVNSLTINGLLKAQNQIIEGKSIDKLSNTNIPIVNKNTFPEKPLDILICSPTRGTNGGWPKKMINHDNFINYLPQEVINSLAKNNLLP